LSTTTGRQARRPPGRRAVDQGAGVEFAAERPAEGEHGGREDVNQRAEVAFYLA
jgi:hypothetical protein